MIKLHDLYFKPFVSEQEIDTIIERMVNEVLADLQDEVPVFVGILNGSFMFAAELFKRIDLIETEITFVKLASYRGVKSTGEVKHLMG